MKVHDPGMLRSQQPRTGMSASRKSGARWSPLVLGSPSSRFAVRISSMLYRVGVPWVIQRSSSLCPGGRLQELASLEAAGGVASSGVLMDAMLR
jgi:hypothetical protein